MLPTETYFLAPDRDAIELAVFYEEFLERARDARSHWLNRRVFRDEYYEASRAARDRRNDKLRVLGSLGRRSCAEAAPSDGKNGAARWRRRFDDRLRSARATRRARRPSAALRSLGVARLLSPRHYAEPKR